MVRARSLQKLGYLVAYGLLAVMLALIILPFGGIRALNNGTSSMSPALHSGDLLLVHTVSASSLRAGNLITYHDPNSSKLVTRRITQVQGAGNHEQLTTGDSNGTTQTQIAADRVVGRVAAVVPGLGPVVMWLTYPLGLALLVVLPAIIVIWSELRALRRRMLPTTNSLRMASGLALTVAVVAVAGGALLAGVSAAATSGQPSPQRPAGNASASAPKTATSSSSPCPGVSISSNDPSAKISVQCDSTTATGGSSSTSVSVSNSSSQSSSSQGNVSNYSSSSTNISVTNH